MLPTSVQPIPGIPVHPPRLPPQPGQVVVAYELETPEVGCCKCDTLSQGGMVAVVVLVLLFWPLAFIPCCSQDCHTKVQRPVYGFPAQGGMPMGAPVYK